jgi:hypothetical protein
MPTQRKNLIEDTPISLAFVLKNGNNAGTNLINMNNNNITQIGELQAEGNGYTNTITSQNMLIQSGDSLQSAAIELSDNGADMYVKDVSGNYVSLATTNSLTENGPTVEIVDATHNNHLILTSQKLYLGSSNSYETPPANKILGTDASGNLKYKCQIIGDGTVATLSEVLDSGHIAGQSIDMSNNNITNVGELQSENSMFESIFSVDKISINNKTTEQELLAKPISDGASVSVKDSTSSYAKLESTSDELVAPFNVPSLHLQDTTNDSQIRLTAQKLYLGSSSSYETPPVNQLLGTDASGNLTYKSQSVATLSEVLDSGHTAGQSIDMSNNNITNIGELQFASAPVSTPVLNQSGTALKIQMNGQDYYIQIYTVPP